MSIIFYCAVCFTTLNISITFRGDRMKEGREKRQQGGKGFSNASKARRLYPKWFKSHFAWEFISIQWTLGWLTSNLEWFNTQMKDGECGFGFTAHERVAGDSSEGQKTAATKQLIKPEVQSLQLPLLAERRTKQILVIWLSLVLYLLWCTTILQMLSDHGWRIHQHWVNLVCTDLNLT